MSKPALGILSIPTISVEPERLFSAMELIIFNQRNQLEMKMAEALVCLKSWYKLKDWEKLESLLFIGHLIQPMYSVDSDDQKRGLP